MTDYSIKTDSAKKTRKVKINTFVTKYGCGDKKLTIVQKKNRIKKILGKEFKKPNIENDFSKYPDDPYQIDNNKNKVLNIEVKDDGSLIMDGIKLNGNENNPLIRTTWNQLSMNDKFSAMSEISQFKEGILKEVSDRTMKIHEENGDLDELLEHPDIDTNEDKETQY